RRRAPSPCVLAGRCRPLSPGGSRCQRRERGHGQHRVDTRRTDMTVITTHPAAPDTTIEAPSPDPLVIHRIHRGELTAATAAGRRFVEVAELLEDTLAESADRHDREGSYPHEALDVVRRTGLPWAAAPEPAGGWGLASVHDLIVGASRLARGNP